MFASHGFIHYSNVFLLSSLRWEERNKISWSSISKKKKSSLGNPLANTVLVQVIKKFHSEGILSKRQYDQVPSDASNDNFRKRLDFCDTLYSLSGAFLIFASFCYRPPDPKKFHPKRDKYWSKVYFAILLFTPFFGGVKKESFLGWIHCFGKMKV